MCSLCFHTPWGAHSLSSTFPLSVISGVAWHVLHVLYLRQYLKFQLKLLTFSLRLWIFGVQKAHSVWSCVFLFVCSTCPVNSSLIWLSWLQFFKHLLLFSFKPFESSICINNIKEFFHINFWLIDELISLFNSLSFSNSKMLLFCNLLWSVKFTTFSTVSGGDLNLALYPSQPVSFVCLSFKPRFFLLLRLAGTPLSCCSFLSKQFGLSWSGAFAFKSCIIFFWSHSAFFWEAKPSFCISHWGLEGYSCLLDDCVCCWRWALTISPWII